MLLCLPFSDPLAHVVHSRLQALTSKVSGKLKDQCFFSDMGMIRLHLQAQRLRNQQVRFLIGTLYHFVHKVVCVAKMVVLLPQIDARLAYNTGDFVFKLTRLTFEP